MILMRLLVFCLKKFLRDYNENDAIATLFRSVNVDYNSLVVRNKGSLKMFFGYCVFC